MCGEPKMILQVALAAVCSNCAYRLELYTVKMTVQKDRLDGRIGAMLARDESPRFVARRLIFFDFTHVFLGQEDRGFAILNEVAEHFRVAISSVRVVGSGQFGYSYFKKRDFAPKTSDLDLAIVSPPLFQKYTELVYWGTDRYQNLVDFPRIKGISTEREFRDYLSAGYFRPDLMPQSPLKESWFSFFNQLSNKYVDIFKDINAGIFMSEGFLEMRNTNLVTEYGKASK